MKKKSLIRSCVLMVMLLLPMTIHAVSGYYSDPGGGRYWCNVYVKYVSNGKSYSWCTGNDENTEMNNFRGFESEHNCCMEHID